jgi:large subunit ribosomal protein L24
MKKSHVKKDDTVLVIAGKDKGTKGRVLSVLRSQDKALVERVNMVKRHERANQQKNQQGGIVEKEAPIHLSNLAVVCSSCGATKGFNMKELEDGRKVRVCKACDHQMGKTTS